MEFGMFVSWVVVGLLAGWLAGFVMKGGGYGLIGDLVLGLWSRASWGLDLPGPGRLRGPGLLPTVFVAFVGAVIVIGAQRKLWHTTRLAMPHAPGDQVEPRLGHAARPGRRPPQEEECMKIRPLHDRILVTRVAEQEVGRGGIIIPDTAKEKPQEGQVVAVGNGKVTEDGKRIALDVQAGDRILFGKFSGSEVKIEDDEYVIMREEDVFAILD